MRHHEDWTGPGRWSAWCRVCGDPKAKGMAAHMRHWTLRGAALWWNRMVATENDPAYEDDNVTNN